MVGFDDTSAATTVWPELTTIRQPLALIAERAAERLVATLRGEPPETQPLAIYVDFKMIERQSTGPARA